MDSQTIRTFLLPVKPGRRLNIWAAATRRRGEEGGDEEGIWVSVRGALSPAERALCGQRFPRSALHSDPMKGDIDPSQACRKACIPTEPAGSHWNGFVGSDGGKCFGSDSFLKSGEDEESRPITGTTKAGWHSSSLSQTQPNTTVGLKVCV